jgi:hypothetical protein
MFSSADTVSKSGPSIFNLFGKLFARPASQRTHEAKELQLAHDLIYKIAKIDPEIIKELYRALREGKEGYVASIVRNINEALAANLNFPHW